MSQPSTSTETDLRPSTPFWWFSGASVVELVRQLTEVGPGKAKLEIHKHGDVLHFQVVDPSSAADDADCPPINESHICPPQCG